MGQRQNASLDRSPSIARLEPAAPPPDNVKTYYVFLASPGDVQGERNHVREFFRDYNQTDARWRGLRFEVLDWENYSTTGVGRPQALITKQVLEPFDDSLALVVGIMAQRLGSNSGTHESGTVEEFEWALERFKDRGFPDIKWFFRNVKTLEIPAEDPTKAGEAVAQWEKVKAFRRRVQEEKAVYSTSFDSVADFGRVFDKDIRLWLNSHERPWQQTDHRVKATRSGTLGAEFVEQLVAQLDGEFALHMRGGDELDPAAATSRYVDLLFRSIRSANSRRNERATDEEAPLAEYVKGAAVRLLVVGGGGSGKTTTLRRLAVDAAHRCLHDPEAPIPVYAKLNAFDRTENGFAELMALVATAIRVDPTVMEDLWRTSATRFLFLLDGFNEIGRVFQATALAALQEFLRPLHHSYVITSRPGSPLEGLVAELALTRVESVQLDREHIKRFLASHGAVDVFDRLSDHLLALASNPFLLWAIAKTVSARAYRAAPDSKGELYESLVDQYIFEVREASKPKPRPTQYNYALVKRPVLGELALQMVEAGVTLVAEDQTLRKRIFGSLTKIREQHSGEFEEEAYIFMPVPPTASAFLNEVVENGVMRRVNDQLEFVHESLQEYFAATHVREWPLPKLLDWSPRLRLSNPHYRGQRFETMVMLSGLLPPEATEPLLEGLADRHPLLAAHCFAECKGRPEVAARLLSAWKEYLDSGHERRREVGVQCLAASGRSDHAVVDLLFRCSKSASFVLERTARDTLAKLPFDVVGARLIHAFVESPDVDREDLGDTLCRHLAKSESAVIAAVFNAWRGAADARRDRLTELLARLNHPKQYVHPSEGAADRVLTGIAVEAELRGDVGLATDADIARALATDPSQSDPHRASFNLDTLHRIMEAQEEEVRLFEAFKGRPSAELVEELRAQTGPAYRTALVVLAERRDEAAIRPLLQNLLSAGSCGESLERLEAFPRDSIQREAAGWCQALAESERRRAELALLSLTGVGTVAQVEQALRNEETEFRAIAAKAARHFGDGVVETLRATVQDESNREVWENAVKSLAHIRSPAALNVLLDALFHQEPVEPWRSHEDGSSARALHECLVAAGAFDATFERLRVELNGADAGPRRSAAAEAARWAPHARVRPLAEALARDRDPFVQVDAVAALVRDGHEELLGELARRVLRHPTGVGWSTTLASIEDRLSGTDRLAPLTEPLESTRVSVAEALADPAPEVRRRAAEMAGVFGERCRATLVRVALEDEDPEVRWVALQTPKRQDAAGVVETLLTALRGSDERRAQNAAAALLSLESPSALEGLAAALDSPECVVRLAVARACTSPYRLGGKADALKNRLAKLAKSDPDVEVRKAAAAAVKDDADELLYDDIRQALGQKDWPQVITSIGEDAPFLPEDVNLYWWRGIARLIRGEAKHAIRDFERAEELGAGTSDFFSYYARALQKAGRSSDALEVIRRGAQTHPASGDLHLVLGWYLFLAGMPEEGARASERAVELDPQLAAAALDLGLMSLALSRGTQAQSAYRRAVAIARRRPPEEATQVLSTALEEFDLLPADVKGAALTASMRELVTSAHDAVRRATERQEGASIRNGSG